VKSLPVRNFTLYDCKFPWILPRPFDERVIPGFCIDGAVYFLPALLVSLERSKRILGRGLGVVNADYDSGPGHFRIHLWRETAKAWQVIPGIACKEMMEESRVSF
jgi:hypothetical protein